MPHKKKLLVLLGAGSSRLLDSNGISQGMPSVEELDQKMQAWAADLGTGNPETYTTDRIVHKLTAGKSGAKLTLLRSAADSFSKAWASCTWYGVPSYSFSAFSATISARSSPSLIC